MKKFYSILAFGICSSAWAQFNNTAHQLQMQQRQQQVQMQQNQRESLQMQQRLQRESMNRMMMSNPYPSGNNLMIIHALQKKLDQLELKKKNLEADLKPGENTQDTKKKDKAAEKLARLNSSIAKLEATKAEFQKKQIDFILQETTVNKAKETTAESKPENKNAKKAKKLDEDQ